MTFSMKPKIRKMVLLMGTLLLLSEVTFHSISRRWDNYMIHSVQRFAQYRSGEFLNTWLGIEIQQYPSDLIVYQELIHYEKPEMIVETGTYKGGLSIYLSTVLEQVNPTARILTVDIDGRNWRKTVASGRVPQSLLQRITFFESDSVSDELIRKMSSITAGKKTMVILDSSHTAAHVLRELQLYSRMVTPGSYLIVNDTHLEGIGWIRQNLWNRIFHPEFGIGPLTAVKQFIGSTVDFTIDPNLPRSYISCSPSGFLKRKVAA
jgi:cephalosporin hydroxylase